MPARLEALGTAAGLDRAALHSQLCSALDAVVHLARNPTSGLRRVAEIRVLVRDQAGFAVTAPAVVFPPDGGCRPGPGWQRLAERCATRGVDPVPPGGHG